MKNGIIDAIVPLSLRLFSLIPGKIKINKIIKKSFKSSPINHVPNLNKNVNLQLSFEHVIK